MVLGTCRILMRTVWCLDCKEKGPHISSPLAAAGCLHNANMEIYPAGSLQKPLDPHGADGASCLELASIPAMMLCGSSLRAYCVLVRASQTSVPSQLSCHIRLLCRVEAVTTCGMASCRPVLPLNRGNRAAGSLPCSLQRTDSGPWCPGRSSATS